MIVRPIRAFTLFRRVASLDLLLLAFVTVASVHAFDDLGLQPRWPRSSLSLDDSTVMSLEGPASSVDIHQRLARIDEIERALEEASTPSDSLLARLIQLYRESPLMKHRVLALQLAQGLPEDDRLQESTLTYLRTFNPWSAERSVVAMIENSVDRAVGHRWLGMLQFEEAQVGLRPELFDESVESFRRATEASDATIEDWRGRAAALVATGRLVELREVAEEMLRIDSEDIGANLFAALAHEAAGLPSRASTEFEAAIQRMAPATGRQFRHPYRYIYVEDDSYLGNRLTVPALPESQRGWWVRLIESEVLFSNPREGVHSWDTSPGQAYLLYGRPEFMRAFRWGSPSEIAGTPELSRYHDEIQIQIQTTEAGDQHRYWVWLVQTEDDRLDPIVFGQFSRFARWEPGEKAQLEMIDPRLKVGPLRLAESLPAVVDPVPELGVESFSAAFRVAGQRMRIESWVATDDGGGTAAAFARLRILTLSGRELDRVQRPFDDAHSRRELAREVSSYPPGIDGWVHGFGAIVPAGEYVTVIDVLDEDGHVLASRDQRLRIDAADVNEVRSLSLSQPILCDAYTGIGGYGTIPREFVRFARAVIPHPEATLHPGQSSISVYYEVYGASLDETGQARLDVEYEIHAAKGFDPYTLGPGYVDGELQRPVVTAVFPDERTDTAAEGLVIKGTRFDVDELRPGNYILLIRVGDKIAKSEAHVGLKFVVPEDALAASP